MKILCFHPSLAPYRLDFFNLLSERAAVKILFLQENLYTQKFDQRALRGELKCRHGELTRGFDIRSRCFRFGVLKAIREAKPDVVLAYEASPVTLELVVLRKLGLIKTKIWTFMDDSPVQVKSRTGLRRVIRDWVVRNVNKVIVPSDAAKGEYERIVEVGGRSRIADEGFNRVEHVETCRNGAKYAVVPIIHDTETMRRNADKIYAAGLAWRETNCPKTWKRVLLFVGRLAEVKNLLWLIERMHELSESIGLVLVGDGALEAELKARVSELELDGQVIFAGRKEGDDLYAMMSMADALVLCSHSETFGAVVAEALQWGTPCVVSNNCGAAVLIENGKNGMVFSYGDASGFAEAAGRIPSRSTRSLLPVDLPSAVDRLVG